jgi:hypothetical protein
MPGRQRKDGGKRERKTRAKRECAPTLRAKERRRVWGGRRYASKACQLVVKLLKRETPSTLLPAEADMLYTKAIMPLDAYIAKKPNDKDVLTILFQLYRNLGQFDKANEYKKRADAIK